MSDRREEPPPGSGLGSWKGFVPIGIAAATALLIGAGVDVVRGHQRAAKKEREAKTAADAEKTAPRFVVGVTASGAALVVRDARSGEDVGVPVAAPQDTRFHRVAAVKDGSFVVASYAGRKVTFQRFLLDEDGRPKNLQEIPKLAVPGASTKWSELAVSPDGDRIAYVTYTGARGRVDVLSAESGAHKTWTTKAPGRIGSLSWSGATLAFVWSPVRAVGGTYKETKHEVRALDTGGAAGDLKLSKAVLTLPKGATKAVFTGKTIVVAAVAGTELTLQAYTPDGKPAGVLWRQRVKGELTDLDASPADARFLAAAGDLYAQNAKAVPGEDLADAAW